MLSSSKNDGRVDKPTRGPGQLAGLGLCRRVLFGGRLGPKKSNKRASTLQRCEGHRSTREQVLGAVSEQTDG